jgi:nucleotide-binding universal stress UspA family protein
MNANDRDIDCILVPLDGSARSEQAIPYAQATMRGAGKIVLLNVIPRVDDRVASGSAAPSNGSETATNPRKAASVVLDLARGRWQSVCETQFETAVAAGDPAAEILSAAVQFGAGLIVMAGHTRGTFGRVAFGSVTDQVVRSGTLPVLVVRPDDALAEVALPIIRRIVVPLDGSDLAASALEVAMPVAKSLNASLHLVNVADFSQCESPAMIYGASYAKEVYDDVMESITTNAQTMLADRKAKAELVGLAVTTEVLYGRAPDAIKEKTGRGDLIVMASHGRGGFRRLVMGSVAGQLLRSGRVPVVIVPALSNNDVTPLAMGLGEPKPQQAPITHSVNP